ncbi:exodeoxyribonuclease III [Bifidobacterium anseris]|uniref:Exodeoxyribonuclease III n=1 Tax=Bifidobacterium anseris TaxID=2020963 RepID=A0A2N5J190_9BIFI|nr:MULTISPECIES: exodeoxyribonuclease III [Bifidobacterium]PLS27980.1 exodeoxyribonuclease III [Bifidobacterium anseris]
MTMTITTSNLNGIRAAKRKGMEKWLLKHTPDVWCMQETRAPQEILDEIFQQIGADYVEAGKVDSPDDVHTLDDVCAIKGRAGVGLVSVLPIVDTRIGLPGLDEDVDTGRWIETDVTTEQGYTVTVACVYVHAGGDGNDIKETQKYRFLDAMTERMEQMRQEAAGGGRQAVICGDFNIAHRPIDLKNAKANLTTHGFLPAERAYIDKWIDEMEYVDVMRDLAGDIQGPYTWWSQRGRAFDNDAGWRLDYQFATPELAQTARGFVVDRAEEWYKRWSDHAPLSITYDV